MVVQRSLAVQRLSAVENTAGSIVGTATWCALHAQDAHMIITVLCERLVDASIPSTSRAALLYVVHEVLLCCASSATTETGKRAIVGAIAHLLPPALRSALSAVPSMDVLQVGSLEHATSEVLQWWRTLHVFPAEWIEELTALLPATHLGTAVDASRSTNSEEASIEMTHVSRLLVAYRHAKDRLHQLNVPDQTSGDALEAAREEAVMSLNAAVRALNETAAHLSVHEMAELIGASPEAVGSVGGGGSAMTAPQDDVLGSFF